MSGKVDILLPTPPIPAGVGGAELLRLPLLSHVRYDIYISVLAEEFFHIFKKLWKLFGPKCSGNSFLRHEKMRENLDTLNLI